MILTAKEIRLILHALAERTVVEPTLDFPYRISQVKRLGYSDNDIIAAQPQT